MDSPRARTTVDILTDAMSSIGSLVRNEIDLARAEVAESLRSYVRALVGLLLAAVLALTAFDVLAGAAVGLLIEAGISAALAALIVAGVALVLAIVVGTAALDILRTTSIAPTRAARNIRRDAEAVKEAYDDK